MPSSNRTANEEDMSDIESETSATEEEALGMLLGGLGLGDVSMAAWDNESDPEEQEEDDAPLSKDKLPHNNHPQNLTTVPSTSISNQGTSLKSAVDNGNMFARAYTCRGYCTRDGRVETPPVRIVHSGDDQTGNIAVATQWIRKGETIFTERAAVAVAAAAACESMCGM